MAEELCKTRRGTGRCCLPQWIMASAGPLAWMKHLDPERLTLASKYLTLEQTIILVIDHLVPKLWTKDFGATVLDLCDLAIREKCCNIPKCAHARFVEADSHRFC